MKSKYCNYCGNELKPEWNTCPNCGSLDFNSQNIKPLNPFQVRNKYPDRRQGLNQRRVNQYGILSLTFGILGLILGGGLIFMSNSIEIELTGLIIEIAFGILAVIFGLISASKRTGYIAVIGVFLGVFHWIGSWYFLFFF